MSLLKYPSRNRSPISIAISQKRGLPQRGKNVLTVTGNDISTGWKLQRLLSSITIL